MNREEVIAKVKKMQALVDHESTPENERNTAYNMLQKMMLKYSIEQAELGENKEDTVVMIRVECRNIKQWQKMLGVNIALGMKCEIITSRTGQKTTDLVFMGHKADVEVATYLFETLSRTLTKAARKQYNTDKLWKVCSEGKYLNGYITAAASAINERLVASYQEAVQEAQCTDLVVVRGQEVQDYMNEQFPNLKKGRKTRVTAIGSREGREKGQSVDLQRGITSTQAQGAIR